LDHGSPLLIARARGLQRRRSTSNGKEGALHPLGYKRLTGKPPSLGIEGIHHDITVVELIISTLFYFWQRVSISSGKKFLMKPKSALITF
jgi:hypothetical protein